MLDPICENLLIKDFLFMYPRNQWGKCVEFTLVLGINTIRKQESGFVSIEELSNMMKQSFKKEDIPDIKAKLSTMKEELEKFNLEAAKTEFPKRSSSANNNQKIRNLRPPKPSQKKDAPKPLLIESTPRFKAPDFTKTKNKENLSVKEVNYLNQENNKKNTVKSENKLSHTRHRSHTERQIGHHRRNQPSPTLEELLCNSRLTQAEPSRIEESNIRKYFKPDELSSISIVDNKTNFDAFGQYTALDETFTHVNIPEEKNYSPRQADFQTPRYPVQVNFSPNDEYDSGILHIADDFLKNPLFSHMSKNSTTGSNKYNHKTDKIGKGLRNKGRVLKNSVDINGFQSERMGILNYSPISSFIFEYDDI